MTRRTLIAILALSTAASPTTTSAQSPAPPAAQTDTPTAPAAPEAPEGSERAVVDRFVDIGGFELRLRLEGGGSPAVVLVHGYGDQLETWNDVAPRIASHATVVSYDRAGLGQSSLGPEPRTFAAGARELHALLEKSKVPAPYVLVGHALGAATVRAFASLFATEVAGLVFVDPFNEQVFRDLDASARAAEIAKWEAVLEREPPGQAAESKLLSTETKNDFPELTSFGRPPDVPSMLLVAGRDRPKGWAKAVLAQYGAWMVAATEGGIVFDPDSRQSMQRDAPAEVADAILRVLFPSIEGRLDASLREKGVEATVELHRELVKRYPADRLRESTLDRLATRELRAGHAAVAALLFRRNAESFPASANAHGALCAALVAAGDRVGALASCNRAIELDPGNGRALDAFATLSAEEIEGGTEEESPPAEPPSSPPPGPARDLVD